MNNRYKIDIDLYFTIEYPISCIREYFVTCEKTVENDFDRIETNNESGFYEDLGNYESAFDIPIARTRIIYYSTLSELNILCEKIFRGIYLNVLEDRMIVLEENEKGSDTSKFFSSISSRVKNMALSHDKNINECIIFIEEKYNINFKLLKGYGAYLKIRDIVNSYKHRDSMKIKLNRKSNIKFDYRTIFIRNQEHDLDVENTIDTIEKFLLNLYRITKSQK